MKLSNLKIKTQMLLSFAVIFIFVISLGMIAWSQTNAIAEQASSLYDHPLLVGQAIGEFTADILSIRLGMKDLMFSHSEKEITETITKLDSLQADALDQIDALYANYLGPVSDVDQVKQEFNEWNVTRAETIRLLRAGQTMEAIERTGSGGIGGDQVDVLLLSLHQIKSFAANKATELYNHALDLKITLVRQLALIVGSILLVSLVIFSNLLRNIRLPLDELARSMQAFTAGDQSSRSTYLLRNEFGNLSSSFNKMAETIELDTILKDKAAKFTSIMLSIYDAKQFFQATLTALAEYSNSQMAAVYLLSSDKSLFEHFVSIGLDEGGKAAFSAETYEGEFGPALATKKIQHIANIADDTQFAFYTVGGQFKPREIITIPVMSNNQIIAVISLASLNVFSQEAIQFLDTIWGTLNARITGILAFREIQALARQLEQQNQELDAQKDELSAQTVELNQQNIELDLQAKQLGESSRLKTTFIANMSHELRTPLNSVIALSGVLYRRLANQIPEEEHSYLEVIERNGKQLLALIDDILDLSRIEAGREEVEVGQFDINQLVTDVVSALNPLAQQKGIQLTSHLNPDLPSLISDASKCQHILQNLVINAVKFTETGQVDISLQQKGDWVEISISDSGIGIAEEHLPHIFNEFRQADSSTSRRYGGTGLGLAIAKKYTELLGGCISVRSALGEGSVFTVSLPLRLENDPIALEERESSQIKTNNIAIAGLTANPELKKILVVDDSEPAVIQLRDRLEQYKFKVLIARNGDEALSILQQAQPDAIILDLQMPDMDGFEVLKIIRDNEKTALLPVLILTARHITNDELRYLKHNNIYQLIQKGNINGTELINAVNSMLSSDAEKTENVEEAAQKIEGKPLVLVVEDNPDNMLTARALLSNDFRVVEATDGKAAIDQARQHVPDLILMDIALPEMDGIQAFKAIRKIIRLQNIPVIALTASAMTSEREIILAYGFDGYIAKPINHLEFMHTIQQVLYGKK